MAARLDALVNGRVCLIVCVKRFSPHGRVFASRDACPRLVTTASRQIEHITSLSSPPPEQACSLSSLIPIALDNRNRQDCSSNRQECSKQETQVFLAHWWMISLPKGSKKKRNKSEKGAEGKENEGKNGVKECMQ